MACYASSNLVVTRRGDLESAGYGNACGLKLGRIITNFYCVHAIDPLMGIMFSGMNFSI